MINIEHVYKSYDGKTPVIKDLSFQVNEGEIVAFIGPNGSGKTTTLKMLTGILPCDEGSLSINGLDIAKEAQKAKQQIGYIPDSPDMFLRLKGVEFLNFMGDVYQVQNQERKDKIKELTELFELTEVLDKPMVSYSHGMRQKMMVIATLLHSPKVWILDEPLTGLDPKAAFILKKLMKEHAKKGNAVLFSTHVLEVAEKLCDRVVVVKSGEKIYEGTIGALQQQHEGKDLEDIFLEMIGYENEDGLVLEEKVEEEE